jgi:hypothetical protein
VIVYARDGEKVFEGRGGLEFIHDVDLSGMIETARYGYVLRRDLFQIGVLREAIVLAFDPYLTPPPQ